MIKNKLARMFKYTADDIERLHGSVARSRQMTETAALEYIQRATRLRASPKPVSIVDPNAPAGHYVIFAGGRHVLYGRVVRTARRIRTYIYDPQTSAKLTWVQLKRQYGWGKPYLLRKN